MDIAPPSYDALILDRTIRPETGALDPAAAQAILRMRMSHEDFDRMNTLASKAQDNLLTDEEKAELDSYMRIGRFLELLKSKARLALGSEGS